MNNIFLLDGQNDSILGHINKKYVIFNEHEQDLPTYRDMFRFTVLGDKPYAEHLGKRNGIIAPGEDGELLEFRVFESIKYRDSEGLKVEVYSLATFLDLKTAKIINPHTTSSESAEWHAKQALAGMEWQVGRVDFKGVRAITFDNYTNPYDYLKRIAREFDLELRFYITHDGQKVTGRYVDLVERVGEWRGRTVEFGRDLQGIRRIEQTDQIVTALLGVGPEREDGTRLEVFVEDKEALERWGRNGQHIIDIYEPMSERSDMTEEELRQYTRTELNKRINAIVSYEANILDLENVPGLENKKIRFGDTIRIKDTKFNPALYLEARVHNQVRDVFNKDSKRVILGDYQEFTEEEVKALFRQMQTEIRKRLERLVLVSIVSTAGNVFKNGVGSTELTAKTFLNGNEVDEDGTKYKYRWHKFDKNGDYVPGFYEEGKTISVSANTIDEKASFRVEIILDNEVLTVHEITLTNVFDGEDGEQGPPGPKGDPGPQGPPGTSVVSIVEYYLATDQNSGVTTSTPGWTTTMQQMTPQKRYLWNYERINFSDGTHQNTNPVIIGVYGDEGEEGRSIVGITEYYLATNASSGVTRNTSGWTTTMQVTTPEKRYLWNYEEITWNKAPTKTYTEPVIIGVHGEQGPKGEDGKTFYTWIKYADTPTSGMSDSPEGKEYIGIAYNKETPTPSTNYADYVWSKFKGEQGIPGPPGEDGQPTYTWVKYADDEHGNGMSDSPEGKLYIGLAFNKTTPEESNNPADYTWSLMPQNIEIGGRNLLLNSQGEFTTNGSHTTVPFEGERLRQYLGEEITISFSAKKLDDNGSKIDACLRSNAGSISGTRSPIFSITDTWQRYFFTFTVTSEMVENTIQFAVRSNGHGGTDQFNAGFKEIKIEKGNKATDWTPAPEDVQAEIDEAKQEAQNAMSTADGKNTVFRQSSTPPTTNRKTGDLWFKTNEGNKMFVWTGSWTETKLDYQALSVGKLSALSADLGEVTAGDIRGVTMNLSNGKFIVDANGNVTFKGNLDGATGTFKGKVEAAQLVVDNPNIEKEGGVGLKLQTAQWQESTTQPYVKTGHIEFNTLNDALEIYKVGLNGLEVPLQGFKVNAIRSVFEGSLDLSSNGEHLKMYGNNSSYVGFYISNIRRGFLGYGNPGSYDYFVRNEAGGNLRLEAQGGSIIISSSAQNVLAGETRYQRGVASTDRWSFAYTSSGFEISPSGTGWNSYSTLFLNRSGAMTRVRGDFAVDGSKSAIAKTENYGERLMYALETPDNRFVSYIEHVLEEGEHLIEIEPMFRETISDYFVVPHVQNAADVVILERYENMFRVWVYGHKAEVVFEVNGKRKGYEDTYMEEVQPTDVIKEESEVIETSEI